MYKALNYWVFGGFGGAKTPVEFIDWAKAAGLDGVELTVGDAIKPDITEQECRAIAEHARRNGIGLRSLATGYYWGKSLGAADEAERNEAIGFTKQYLRMAHWLGAETVLVVPGASRVPWDPSRPVIGYGTVWSQSVKSLLALEPEAGRWGVSLALENVWGRFLFSPMEWKLYLDQFRSGWIGMYLDIANCGLYVRAQDYIELLGTRIKAVHVKNWKGDALGGGNLHGFGEDLLDGEVDFAAVKRALEAVHYAGPLTAEMIPFSRLPNLGIPDAALASRTAVALRQL